MSLLESQRSILEEIDVLEQSISQRVQRNPLLLPSSQKPSDVTISSSKKRPLKEELLQQHELKFLKNKYRRHCSTVLENKDTKRNHFEEESNKLKDPAYEFKLFDSMLNDIKQHHELQTETNQAEDISKIYRMYSSAPSVEEKHNKKDELKVKRKYILSSAASHIDFDGMFTPDELYGKYLDLFPFYETYKSIVDHNVTYVEYLSIYDQVPYEIVKRNNTAYSKYIKDLAEYLLKFIEKVQPLSNIDELQEDMTKQFSSSTKIQTDGKSNDRGEVYCEACDKLFAKDSVYKGHLSGKKHQRNIKNRASSESDIPNSNRVKDLEFDEFKIRFLGEKLNDYRSPTISNAERKAALTDRERIAETISIVGDESDYTTINSTSGDESDSNESSDNDEYNMKDLPIGVDGKPIPYWLYKLQGYHKTYECEICGNTTYKGRAVFAKHFNSAKHQHGLGCLGISDDYMALFKSIVKIDEALDLWRRLKKERRIKEGDIENAIEVEDEEGNVLSEKDYLELKKQGLL